MFEKITKIEKIIFYLLVFCLPLQVRHIFFFFGQNFSEWQSVHLYAADILVFLLLIFWLLRSWTFDKLKLDGIEWSLLAFIFFASLSLVMAGNIWLGVFGLAKILEFSALFFYIKRNFNALFRADVFWLSFVSGALLQSFAAIAQFFKQQSLGLSFLAESPIGPDLPGVAKIIVNGEKVVRAYGTVPHPNILAAIISAAIFGLIALFVSRAQKSGKLEKLFSFFILAFLIFGLALTFSRTIIISTLVFLAGWLAFLIFRQKENRIWVVNCGISLLVICAVILICFWPYFSSRFDASNLGESQSVSLRLVYGQIALDMIKNSVFLGIGQGNFTVMSGEYFTEIASWFFQPVHNIYLLIVAETGIFGLSSFLTFLFLVLKKIKDKFKSVRIQDGVYLYSFVFIIYNLLLIGFFDHFPWDLQQGQLLFWIVLGVVASFGAEKSRAHSLTDKAQASGA